MKIAVALVALAAASLACDVQCQWTEWKAKYNKQYTAKEEAHRFGVFQANLEKIARLNAEQPSATFAVNKFSDLTAEEFSGTYAKFDTQSPRRALPERRAAGPARRGLPANWISPATTPAQNQGQCGSCWAFASSGVAEGAYKFATGKTVRVAPQQLVDCASKSGCSGGNYDQGLGWIVDQFTNSKLGMTAEGEYPYSSGQSQRSGSCQSGKSTLLQLSEYGSVNFDETVGAGIDTDLQKHGPLGMAIDAGQLQQYSGGVIRHNSDCNNRVDHAVLLVGWANVNGIDCWIVKNSWGSDWGISPVGWDATQGGGFFYIERNGNGDSGACLIKSWGGYWATAVGGGGNNPSPTPCSPQTTEQACGTSTCGVASDLCGGTITCGSCGSGLMCSSGQCVTYSCTPKTKCSSRSCGYESDGCGGTISCGKCSGWGKMCVSGQCSLGFGCTPKSAGSVCNSARCGTSSDDCDGTVSCGTCAAGQACQGGTCVATKCTPLGSAACAGKCGSISDGCGGYLTCGNTCQSGQVCQNNQCQAPTCVPKTASQVCGTAVCGNANDGCGGTVSCGTCSGANSLCSAGQCTAPSCVSKTKVAACGANNCNAMPDGCGGSVSCGTCAANQQCRSNTCQDIPSGPSAAGWAQVAGFNVVNDASGNTVITSSTATEQKLIWTASSSFLSNAYFSFQTFVQTKGPATIGLGSRLGQQYGQTDSLLWKIVIDASNNAQLNECTILQGNEDCSPLFAWAWDATKAHNFTVSFADATDKLGKAIVNMVPMFNNMGAYGSQWKARATTTYSMSPRDYWSKVGQLFVTAAGPVTFTIPPVKTKATLKVSATSCHSPSAFGSYVSMLLKVPRGIDDVTGVDPCDKGGFKSFIVPFGDNNLTQSLGFGAPASVATSHFTYASELASNLQNILTTGNPANLGYQVTSAAIVEPSVLAAEVAEVVALSAAIGGGAGAGLSTGAIVGIAVGASVGGILLAGAVGAGIWVSTRPEPDQPIPADFQPKNPFRKTFFKVKVARGVDVLNPGKDHGSITARAPPVA